MGEPTYREGRYDTTYLDRLLASRQGRSFSELDDREEEIVTIAVALDAFMRSTAGGNGQTPAYDSGSAWQRIGRQESLRG
jgi:hypothetical protein